MSTTPTHSIPVPEPELTAEEMVQRARDMVPTLRERQAHCEEIGRLPDETSRELIEAGFYRILQPRRFGGYEFDMPTYFRVVMELARGCPSTGWCFCLAGAHVLQVSSMYSEQAQREFFGPDGHFACASFGAPVGVAAPKDGGYVINGTFPYASGIPYSTHFMGQTLLNPEDPTDPGLMFVIPREQFERLVNKPFAWDPRVKRYELEHYQRYVGEAIAEIACAEAAVIQGAEQWMELARQNVEEGRPFTAQDDARLQALQDTACRIAWHAVEGILFRTGGSGSARNGERMQRYWRDMSTYWSHNTPAQRDLLLTRLGRMELGLPLDGPGMAPVRVKDGGA